MKVLTGGESMVLFDPDGDAPAQVGTRLTLRVAGAESNFAVAVARLGVGVRWISRLGQDAFGDAVLSTIAREGVDVGSTVRDPIAPTGLYFKWRVDGATRVDYRRIGSAASYLSPDDLSSETLDDVALVHLTGITFAIGAGTFVVELARRASERGIPVMFDPNFRPALWQSPSDAASSMAEVLPYVTWYLCGQQEAQLLTGASTPELVIASLVSQGVADVVVRIGAGGAIVRENGRLRRVLPPRLVSVLDEIGAGDAFAAGFAYGLLHGWTPARCVHAGHVVAARALGSSGDWECVPLLGQIASELEDVPRFG